MIKFIVIILIDCLWVYTFFRTYLQGGEVHPFFLFLMIPFWFLFNLFCMFLTESSQESKEEEENKKRSIEQDSLVKRILFFVILNVKYLAIGLVNLLFIGIMFYSYTDNGTSIWVGCIFLLIYNLLSFGFILGTRKMKAREFYRFLIIVCPVLIGIIWYIVA